MKASNKQWVIYFFGLFLHTYPQYLNHKDPSVLSGSGFHDSSRSSLVTKLHGPEDVWAVDCSKPCPSHPSLLGRLTTSGGTAVWAVTPTCQPYPRHLLLHQWWKGHLQFYGAQQLLKQADREAQNTRSECQRRYFVWKWVWHWSWLHI